MSANAALVSKYIGSLTFDLAFRSAKSLYFLT